jgi:hypothetical protein
LFERAPGLHLQVNIISSFPTKDLVITNIGTRETIQRLSKMAAEGDLPYGLTQHQLNIGNACLFAAENLVPPGELQMVS